MGFFRKISKCTVELIPSKTNGINFTRDETYEILGIFHEKEVQLDTPLVGRVLGFNVWVFLS